MSEPYRRAPRAPSGRVVVVGEYIQEVEGELERDALELGGIVATLRTHAVVSAAVGLAQPSAVLEVDEVDEADARAILERSRLASRARDHEPENEPGAVHRCPRCELAYTRYGRWKPTGIPALVAVGTIPITLLSRTCWRCQTCGHAWDDVRECPPHPTPLAPGDPRPVFRMKRTQAVLGVFVGVFAAVCGLVWVGDASKAVVIAFLGCAIGAGYVSGLLFQTEVCSLPSCRGPLARGAEECKGCGGTIAGEVKTTAEHWAMAAEVRRELAAAREERPKKRSKKKRRADG